MAKDNIKKYSKLEWAGPVFPEIYKSQGYKLNGKPLPILAEEMLWGLSRFLETDHEKKILTNGNAWSCIKPELTPELQKLIFPNDFMSLLKQMKKVQIEIREMKKELPKEVKEFEKSKKEAIKQKNGTALIDGKPTSVMYTIEPPSFIAVRGKDPKFGLWKYRVSEEDVEINIVNSTVPKGNWKRNKNDPTLMSVGSYKVQCGPKGHKLHVELFKKLNFGVDSDAKKGSDTKKFNKASALLKNWKKAQDYIWKNCFSSNQKEKEAALCTYLIQMTGIRVGNKRDLTISADTQGASTLRKEHITLEVRDY